MWANYDCRAERNGAEFLLLTVDNFIRNKGVYHDNIFVIKIHVIDLKN